jgi:hypothetical protein
MVFGGDGILLTVNMPDYFFVGKVSGGDIK